MEDIKEAFDDEKREFEAQTTLLKQEVAELQRALEAEDKNRKKLDEVMRTNNKLQHEKRMVEISSHSDITMLRLRHTFK